MRIVVALGGNALAPRGAPISAPVQRASAARAAEALVPLIREHDVVLTHGNGPQVGLLLLESEADESVPAYPLDVLGAESEGMIGYLLEEALRRVWPELDVATMLTCSIVDEDDPAFQHPSKPVGPVYDAATATRVAMERTFEVAEDTGGFRRVVPSPEPRGVLQARTLLALVGAGVTVIAAGGGGVPVVLDDDARPTGVEAVVDKDLAAVVLADLVDADVLMLLTDVDAVYRRFGTRGATPIRKLTTTEARALIAGGAVGIGSMGPKLEAACRAADAGRFTVIAALDDAEAALRRNAGTRIVSG